MAQVTRFREVTERVTVERPGEDGSPPVVTTAEQHAVRKTTMTRGAAQRKVTERPSLTTPQVGNFSFEFENDVKLCAPTNRCALSTRVRF